jgi:hypothetical protein
MPAPPSTSDPFVESDRVYQRLQDACADVQRTIHEAHALIASSNTVISRANELIAASLAGARDKPSSQRASSSRSASSASSDPGAIRKPKT